MAMVADNLNRLDNVGMLQGGADAEFGGDLFMVFAFGFSRFPLAELFDGVDGSPVFGLALDQSNGAASSRSQDFAPFAVFFCHGGMRSVFEALMGCLVAMSVVMRTVSVMVV